MENATLITSSSWTWVTIVFTVYATFRVPGCTRDRDTTMANGDATFWVMTVRRSRTLNTQQAPERNNAPPPWQALAGIHRMVSPSSLPFFMMLSRLAQQAVKRALPARTVNFALFSTAELVPGYGKGKTSTGIVSRISLYTRLY